MLPYDGTPIKDELVRTGRLRGDVCSPNYDFLDPRLEDFYQGLTDIMNIQGWIHGLGAVTTQLTWAWHEVAVMTRLFPSLTGMSKYQKTLRGLTRKSNDLLLSITEDLSYLFSDGREIPWDPATVENSRKRFLEELVSERDAFVYRHEKILLDALEQPIAPLVTEPASRLAISA